MPGEVIIKVRGLKKYFDLRKGFFDSWSEPVFVKAVDDVNFVIHEGEILGLVGESGCGKTTTGRLLTRLEDPTGGFVFFLGRDIARLEGEDLKVFRRNIQMVFQDPYESLNPRTTVLQTVMEPLVNHNIGSSSEARTKMCIKALEDAGLAPAKEYLNRFPHELSGGQRQRVAIARALVINPRVIVADEPVSMLDVSIRAGVLNLMLDLRDKYRIPYLFITHDIAVARYVSDRLGVMYLGRVVEIAETDEVIFRPRHPYTQALISAVPKPNPEAKHGRITIKGEIPSAVDIPLGCRFRPRCPKAFRECGWEARDLQDHLMDEEKVDQAGHPMNKHMGKLMPKGFSLMIDVREGGSADKVVGFIKEKAESMKGTHPMFDALMTVGKTLGDRAIEVRCSSMRAPSGAIAKELHDLLTSVVEYKDKDHPMFGRILGISLDKDKIVLEVGRDQASILAFAKDFVRSYVGQGYDEFKAMSGIQATADKSKVIISFRDGKKPAARVAREAADVIDSEFERGRASKYGGLLLPVAVKKNKVLVRMIGPEAAWSGLAPNLEKHLKDRLPGGVDSVSTKKIKGPSVTVVAKFITVEEPPLIDVGGGHQVACYLYRQAAR